MPSTPVGLSSLNGIALPVNTRWLDRRQFAGVTQQVRYALSGAAVHVYAQSIVVGRRITLSIERPYSHMYTDKYDEILGLETPGGTLLFRWVDVDPDTLAQTPVDHTVVFDYDSGPALDFAHIDTVGNSPAKRLNLGRYQGQIHLLTV